MGIIIIIFYYFFKKNTKTVGVGIKAQNDMLGLGPLSGIAELSEEKQVVIRIPQ